MKLIRMFLIQAKRANNFQKKLTQKIATAMMISFNILE